MLDWLIIRYDVKLLLPGLQMPSPPIVVSFSLLVLFDVKISYKYIKMLLYGMDYDLFFGWPFSVLMIFVAMIYRFFLCPLCVASSSLSLPLPLPSLWFLVFSRNEFSNSCKKKIQEIFISSHLSVLLFCSWFFFCSAYFVVNYFSVFFWWMMPVIPTMCIESN